MAVPFYVPEGGPDEAATSASGSSSDGSSTSSSQSPNTTTSATQTPLLSPVNNEHLVMAFFEALHHYSVNSATPVFQFPPPPSPSCSMHNPSYAGGCTSTPRTPRTSVSFGAGEESFFHHYPPVPPQSAPPMSSHHQMQPHQQQPHYHHHPTYPFLHRSHSDAARRSRRTSTGEYQSEHETSWDETERFDNFTAGRERLQEFNGRIPPRRKKIEVPRPQPESRERERGFTLPSVVIMFVFAMGVGFLVAR